MIIKDTAYFPSDSRIPGFSGRGKITEPEAVAGDINPLAVKLVLLLAAKSKLAVIDDIAEEIPAAGG